MPDLVDKIIEFESGEMSDEDTLAFFAELVKTGTINHLQGSYQRTAVNLLRQGYIDQAGNVLRSVEE